MRRRHLNPLAIAASIALIWLLFMPAIGASYDDLFLDWRPPVLLAALLGLVGFFGLARWRLGRITRWLVAALLLIAAGVQATDAAVQHFMDRPLDIYFDVRHLPNLLGLYVDAVGIWRGGAVIVGVLLALVVLLLLLGTAIAALDRAAQARPDFAVGAIMASLLGFALLAIPASWGGGAINRHAAVTAEEQAIGAWRAFAALHGLDQRYAAALNAPQPPLGALPGLKGRDVYLVFIESYGTVVLDEPSYRAVIAPALEDFAASVGAAGYQLVSSRLVSPVYGGGSWLAHGTIATGIKLDPLLDELILNSQRKGLPRYLSAAGYRTVEVMPGIKKAYPEGTFWGFDAHYYAAALDYKGPEFGWFDIPDQYTLGQFSAHELTPDHAPLFAQIVLVSSHAPFAPVPPYLDDWSDAGAYATVPQAAWPKIYAAPDWKNLDRAYLDSIAYDLKTLGAWLVGLDSNALVIILGDHQPPDLSRGNKADWTVPIHVLSRDPDLVRPFAALGYEPGALPAPQEKPEGMEKFLGEFLSGFATSVATAASTPPQSPAAPATFQP